MKKDTKQKGKKQMKRKSLMVKQRWGRLWYAKRLKWGKYWLVK